MGDFFGLWRAAQLKVDREVKKLHKAIKENTPSNVWLLDPAASQRSSLAIKNAGKGPQPQERPQEAVPSRRQRAPREIPPRAESSMRRQLPPADITLLLQRKDPSDEVGFGGHERQAPTDRPLTGREILYKEMKEANSQNQGQSSSAASAPIKRKKSARRSPSANPLIQYAPRFEAKIAEEMRKLEQTEQNANEEAAKRRVLARLKMTNALLANERARAAERNNGDTHVAKQIAAERHKANKEAELAFKKNNSTPLRRWP
jgi:hypothetical protein